MHLMDEEAAVIPSGDKLFKLILRVVSVLFLTAVFSFFRCVSDNLTFILLYSTVLIIHRTFAVRL